MSVTVSRQIDRHLPVTVLVATSQRIFTTLLIIEAFRLKTLPRKTINFEPRRDDVY